MKTKQPKPYLDRPTEAGWWYMVEVGIGGNNALYCFDITMSDGGYLKFNDWFGEWFGPVLLPSDK